MTRDIVTGRSIEARPDLLVCVTGATNLRLALEARKLGPPLVVVQAAPPWQAPRLDNALATERELRRILDLAVHEPVGSLDLSDRNDRLLLHAVWGMLVLVVALFLMFQAVFSGYRVGH